MFLLPDVGASKNSQPFSVRGHEPVLDAVVDHFYEVPGTVGAAVQIPLLGRAVKFLAAGRARNLVAPSRCERGKDWVEVLYDLRLAANHHAVAALDAPNASAGADVHVMNLLRCEFLGS